MYDTSFVVPNEKRGRVATIYETGRRDVLSPLPKEYGSTAHFSGGGGLFSTCRDYARFAQMILSGGELQGVRILEPATVTAMSANQIGKYRPWAIESMDWALDWPWRRIQTAASPVLERCFWSGVYSTNFWICPAAISFFF